ncbi:GAF domain-containing protein [Phormidium sp. LEGE 05292]|uniref:ATP-binding protein n=1 Tax=[Phormidium] sp. LEGE 05292 TaxID=767427 RepID=UPI00187FC2FD|nr:ATP-binding protein [Phormidium sp. LEGE 05292]MBE9225465.1 GAF domain-containing protein [Phormidium sp. LEGE 05292]
MKSKRHSHKSSLFSQLLAGFAISLTTVGLTTLSLNYLSVASNLEHEVQERAEAIARSIDFANKGLLETGNIRALKQIVQKYATFPEVVEVLIIDPNGNTLAHTNSEEQSQSYKSTHPELISIIQQIMQTGVEAHHFMRMHNKPVIVYLSPFQSELFNISKQHGLVLVVIDREIEQQKAQQIFWQSTATMGTGFLLIIGIMGFVVRKIVLKPLDRLNKAVLISNKTKKFSLPTHLPNSEIKFLADTFDTIFHQQQQIEMVLNERAELLRKQNILLSNLAKHRAIIDGNLQEFAQEITLIIAHLLNVERASVWLYDSHDNYLVCLNLFEPISQGHSAGAKLNLADYPAYFKAIDTEDLISAYDAHHDPRTSEFSQTYLTPLNIRSMLDVPIRLKGKTVGVLCVEKVAVCRLWSAEDENFLRSIAELFALAIEARDRQLAEQALKQSEILLRQQAKELETTLQELKLTQSQMIQNEKMSSLGQMVAGVAHEINNPVNFIYGNITHVNQYFRDLWNILQLYQRVYPIPTQEFQAGIEEIDLDFLAEDLPKVLSSMKVGIERIGEIVRSLRIFSRLDEAEFKEADLHQGIDSTLMILEHRLQTNSERSQIKIVKNYSHIPQIECYPGQLNQVLLNIINNSIDALEEKMEILKIQQKKSLSQFTPTIVITTESINYYWIRIRIVDNGLGISQEVQSKLFDPFFTTKPVGKGTGLGLSISYQIIVEKHNGKLYYSSEVGKGTEFAIEIPVCQNSCKAA